MSEGVLHESLTVKKQCSDDTTFIDKDDIIDISTFDFVDTDRWLYVPQSSEECKVHNLHSWLRNETDSVLPSIDISNKKYVDTRTFTRPKKRTTCASFESMFDTTLSLKLPSTMEECGTNSAQNISYVAESVPSILKPLPTMPGSVSLIESGPASGQESMEVFLTMSESKGIDSFINLTEPGFSDPIMNVSQPSIFYSSIISLPKEESVSMHNSNDGENADNVSLATAHISNDLEATVNSTNMNDTFSRIGNITITKNESHNKRDATFINSHELLNKMGLNSTYDTKSTPAVPSCKIEVSDQLSSTYTHAPEDNAKAKYDKKNEDLPSLDATYVPSNMQKRTYYQENRTYIPSEKHAQDDVKTFENDVVRERTTNYNVKSSTVVHCSSPSVNSLFLVPNHQDLNSTFKLPSRLSPSSAQKSDALNSTFNTIEKPTDQTHIYDENMKAAFALRQELLEEVQRSDEHRLDTTQIYTENKQHSSDYRKQSHNVICDENYLNDMSGGNKYNTYKKESAADRLKVNKDSTYIHVEDALPKKKVPERKYFTFTKKTAKAGEKSSEPLNNLNETKTFSKLQQSKTNVPRMLSKLPQFLQKSNSNLVSGSGKTTGLTSCTNVANITFMKGSQPNIVRDIEPSLSTKRYVLQKMKSGSEQRLLELNTNPTDFQLIVAGGSTESIDSTQSAHSAPDLDDRLITYSDNSHNTYAMKPMNILHQTVHMQEESLGKESTPKLKRRIQENSWTGIEQDLPSPIQKNGVDNSGSNPLLINTQNTITTSSPLISPVTSSQTINTDGRAVEVGPKQHNEPAIARKQESINKPVRRSENKTRLRLPTNFYGGPRGPTGSAIPRPPSRIPAFRFARPVLKNT